MEPVPCPSARRHMAPRDGETSVTDDHDSDELDAEGLSLLHEDSTGYGEDGQDFDELAVFVAASADNHSRAGET